MSIELETAQAPDSFCERCAKYDLEERFFPSLSVDGPYKPHDGLLDWTTVIMNNKKCVLCRMLIFSLMLHPRFKDIGFTGGKFCGISLLLVEIGRVTWRPPDFGEYQEEPIGHGWIRGEDGFHRVVRYLMVHGRGGGAFVSNCIYPHIDDCMTERENLLLSRSLPEERLDVAKLQAWLSTCKMLHTNTCDPGHWVDMASVGLRMIDLQNLCVAMVSTEVSYCALSYCWGNKSFLKLTSANMANLFEESSLSPDHLDLPATIRDAMDLSLRLGIRYLWVDALCILQDDDSDKQRQIPLMGKIYKHAVLTIVAAAGDDPSAGLVGLRTGTRNVRQISQRVGRVWLYASSRFLSRSDTIANTAWKKRAWTLQEHALSTRLLIFTPVDVFWECSCSLWDESAQYEVSEPENTEIVLN